VEHLSSASLKGRLLTRLERLARDKRSSLFNVSSKENSFIRLEPGPHDTLPDPSFVEQV